MKPFYTVNFNARMCHMKISVNGIPLVSMDVEGQCSTRYPCNNHLLASGTATIRCEVRPLEGEIQLHKRAFLSVEVELFDMDSPVEPLSKMASYQTPSVEDAVIPFVVHEDVFRVEVPYTLVGWKQSTKLDRFEDDLRPMVFRKYNSMIALMRNRNFAQYEEAFRERENIMAACFYMSPEEKQARMKDIEHDIVSCTEIVPLSSKDQIELADDGRLVRLIKSDGESALRLKNDLEESEIMIEMWLHMKPGNTELTII